MLNEIRDNNKTKTHSNPQDTMDQLMTIQKMDGAIIWPQLMMDSAKIPPQAFVEGRPKRQRPTHQGELKKSSLI